MSALVQVRGLELKSWCIGAGAVRNLVWDHLHGYEIPSHLPDIDVVYFDSRHISSERDKNLQLRLATAMPKHQWEVTNQAGVHLWYENCFGSPMLALTSLEEGVGSWPEYATCIGVRLDADNSPRIIAPHGLDDLFELRVRHNPVKVNLATYQKRLALKQFNKRWPLVQIAPD
jgi:uncharacterized protein